MRPVRSNGKFKILWS